MIQRPTNGDLVKALDSAKAFSGPSQFARAFDTLTEYKAWADEEMKEYKRELAAKADEIKKAEISIARSQEFSNKLEQDVELWKRLATEKRATADQKQGAEETLRTIVESAPLGSWRRELGAMASCVLVLGELKPQQIRRVLDHLVAAAGSPDGE
jgi:hypothetical protein